MRDEAGYYRTALRELALIRSDFEKALDPRGPHRLDAPLAAATPTTAFEIAIVYGNSMLMQYADLLTVRADHAGIPGLSILAGLDSAGHPIGIRFLGQDFSERGCYESPGRVRWPQKTTRGGGPGSSLMALDERKPDAR